jgi:hypothetical protein
MIPADAVGERLYEFAQNLTRRRPTSSPPENIADATDALLSQWAAQSPMTLDGAVALGPGEHWCLAELLRQYVMFLLMNPHLQFPPDFLDDSTDGGLGSGPHAYIAEHRWPFPQMLPQ